VVLLLLSTTYWSLLGARLQIHNADQLSDPYMFQHWTTFQSAFFPGSHTFLLKWPIFWLLHLVGVSAASLAAATVAVVLLTVATLAAVLYAIDRRPLVFGTLCIALSLVLLLVPAQPYAGGLLPVNMAMLTTRNLEYAIYLLVLALFVRAARLRSWGYGLGVGLLSILIASDKLFLSLSVGGALLALVTYLARKQRALARAATAWLIGSVIAGVLAEGGLMAAGALHVTHLVGSGAASPYGAATGTAAVLGVAYAALGLLTNLGANPAYDNRLLSQLPGDVVHRLWSVSGAAYLTALGLSLYALLLAWRVCWPTLRATPKRPADIPKANLLALWLIWSTVVAFGVFIVSNHYYAVDARYLTIGFFALAVSVSVGLRQAQWRWPEDLLLISSGLLLAIGVASLTALHIHRDQIRALSDIDARNNLVAEALRHHPVDVLVGDYWRVLPVKFVSGGAQNVMPLGSCTQPSATLTSGVWQPDLSSHSFAYLVTLDGSLTNFPNCSLPQITAQYGQPNATQIVAGSLAKPREVLLFYDQGAHRPQPGSATTALLSSVRPVRLPAANCDQSTTMNVVAHEDDDLLFLSPDLLHEIQAGQCVRTVYLTAGDSGYGKFYWLGRQLGAEAAYGRMLGLQKPVWDQQVVSLAAGEYVTVATLRGNPKVSLVFFNLPDGDLQGQGFESSGDQSLSKLQSGDLPRLTSVDGQSGYTSAQLVAALVTLMNTYQPAAIHTQADVPSASYPDHSDHIAAGKYAVTAASVYDRQSFGDAFTIPVVRYIGYPIHSYGENVSGSDLSQKEAAFLAYARHDGGVCQSEIECADTPTYGAYISRQYAESADQ